MATTEERLSRLAGVYDHLATKADIAGTKNEIVALQGKVIAVEGKVIAVEARVSALEGIVNAIANEMRGEFRIHRWVLGLLFALNLLIVGRVFEIIPF
ncbi:MAG: hypothetical protein OXE05_04540 [Chloroflexi bacterium]|nr:hypothetical protein [Chloroflexota bacterium]